MRSAKNNSCPICRLELKNFQPGSAINGTDQFDCNYCGVWRANRIFVDMIASEVANNARLSLAISFTLRKQQLSNEVAILTNPLYEQLQKNPALPSPNQRCIDFVLWLGRRTADLVGNRISVSVVQEGAIVGVAPNNHEGFGFVLFALEKRGLLEVTGHTSQSASIRLTLSGWEFYDELQRGHVSTRNAFMAMPFGVKRLDRVFSECMKRAAGRAGFDLKRLDEEPRAGLIDDRLRVDIRNSRFVVVELTDANAGAYWEAGFAEGLGKPVIYTCEETFFKNTHFDTNHMLHVLWRDDDLTSAENRLAATIRATLPAEAKMTD